MDTLGTNGVTSVNNTLAILIRDGAIRLKDNGINSAALDSRILLSYAIGYSTEDLFLKRSQSVSSEKVSEFFKLIKRRQGNEPVAYIVGKKEFYGIDFIIDKNVLIPRPESETVIDLVKFCFKSSLQNKISILELGVGSGCLLLTLLKILPYSNGVGVDISDKALQITKENATRLNLYKRVHFIKSNWANLKSENKFDLIISNPPYITSKDISCLQEDVKNYEPHIALDGGQDGLDCYKQIFSILQNFLKKNGICIFEIGSGQFDSISKLANDYNFKVQKFKKDLSGKIRAGAFIYYNSS